MDGAPLRRMPRDLDAVEQRVVGCLLEKERITPDAYPLTLSALVAACNQKTSREPVTDLTEREVASALDRLFGEVLVWHHDGARARRWSHNLDRRLGLGSAHKALLALLLLRGPQTVGELKGRSDRLHGFESLGEVEDALEGLADPADPLVAVLPREPGRKEPRWTQLLGGPVESAPEGPDDPGRSRGDGAARPAARRTLEERIDRLEDTVDDLRIQLEALVAELGGGSGSGRQP